MIEYHDREWGVPVHDDRKLFEFLVLDGAQAGLSWRTILQKREAYREAYDQYDPENSDFPGPIVFPCRRIAARRLARGLRCGIAEV